MSELAPLEGIDGFSYTHSWSHPQYASPSGLWWQRLAQRGHLASWTAHYQSGARMAHLAHRVHGYYASSPLWTPARGLAVVIGSVNDLLPGGLDPLAVAGYRNPLSSVVAMLSAGIDYRANGAAWTFPAGTWAAGTNGSRVSTSPQAVAECAFSSAAGTAVVHLIGWPAGIAGGVARVRLDGVIVAEVPTADAAPPAGVPLGYTYLTVRVPVPAAGSHTVRVSNAGAAGTWLGVQNLTVEAAAPPTVLAVVEPQLRPDPALWPQHTPAVRDAYLQATADVCAGVPGARVVDLDPGWEPAMFHADGVHPNDAGHARVADVLGGVLAAQGFREGQNRLVLP